MAQVPVSPPGAPAQSEAMEREQPAVVVVSVRGTDALHEYVPRDGILTVSHPEPVSLATRAQITAYFEEVTHFWREYCGGRKVYVLVDYDNLSTNSDDLEWYGAAVKRFADECAFDIVRYNGNMVQRMNGRLIAIQIHAPSNLYSSREEALAVVAGLRRGTIKSIPP